MVRWPLNAQRHVEHSLKEALTINDSVGAREFSHFNLSCVEFCRATPATPDEYLSNQKIGHTVRLMKFLDPPRDGKPILIPSRPIVIH